MEYLFVCEKTEKLYKIVYWQLYQWGEKRHLMSWPSYAMHQNDFIGNVVMHFALRQAIKKELRIKLFFFAFQQNIWLLAGVYVIDHTANCYFSLTFGITLFTVLAPWRVCRKTKCASAWIYISMHIIIGKVISLLISADVCLLSEAFLVEGRSNQQVQYGDWVDMCSCYDWNEQLQEASISSDWRQMFMGVISHKGSQTHLKLGTDLRVTETWEYCVLYLTLYSLRLYIATWG